jgi:hypothetical protein
MNALNAAGFEGCRRGPRNVRCHCSAYLYYISAYIISRLRHHTVNKLLTTAFNQTNSMYL